MADPWRRPSAFPSDSEFSLSQTDEVLLKTSSRRTSTDVVEVTTAAGDAEKKDRSPVKLTESERRRITWMIYAIGFVDLFGVSMMISLLPKLTRNLGASRALGGIIGSFYGTLQVFSSPVMGKFSDIYGRKVILLLSYAGPCLGYVGLGLSGSLIMLVISRIPNGILKHGLSVSKAYLSDITHKRDRQTVLGHFNAISSLGFIFGPLLSGYVADWDPSLRTSLLASAFIFGFNFLLVLFLVPSLSSDEDGAKDSTKDLKEMWRNFDFKYFVSTMNVLKGIHWREIYDLISIRFLLTFSVMMFRNNFPVFLEEHFPMDNTALGKILAFNGIASAVASATSGQISKLYKNHILQLIHFTILLTLALLGLTFAPTFYFIVALLVPLSLATSNLRICMLSLMLQKGRENERGAIIGLANAMSSVSRMLAPTVVGFAQEYSVELAGYFGAMMAGSAVVCLMVMPGDKTKHD